MVDSHGLVQSTRKNMDVIQAMNYESRAVKGALDTTTNRLVASRARVPPLLQPQQGKYMDWERPSVSAIDLQQENGRASRNPLFEEMREALLFFERTHHTTPRAHASGHPTRDRAFHSALRTLLSDIVLEPQDTKRETMIIAAHKWFAKYRPRGSTDDPAVSAALAASLSINSMHTQQHKPQHMLSERIRPFIAQGTKHEFFGVFSRDSGPPPVKPSGLLDKLRAAGATREAPPSPPHYRPQSRPLPDMPVVMQPAMLGGSGLHLQRHSVSAPASAWVQRTGSPEQQQQPASKSPQPMTSAVGSVFASRSKARVIFDPDRLEAPPGAPGSPQGKTPSWFQGPYRPDAATSRASWLTPAEQAEAEDAEVEELRRRWSSYDDQAAKSAAHVGRELQRWALQRARLEEEIVRRQEASRYATPGLRAAQAAAAGITSGMYGQAGAMASPSPTALPPSASDAAGPPSSAAAPAYISAYAGVTVDAVTSIVSGFEDPAAGMTADALLVPGLAPAAPLAMTAREVRLQGSEEYERDSDRIVHRMSQLGLHGRVRMDAMSRALSPVPDKPFLECIARLPHPGEHLPSRPSSVKTATGRKSSSRSGRVRSAKSRPASK